MKLRLIGTIFLSVFCLFSWVQSTLAEEGRYIITRDENNRIIIIRQEVVPSPRVFYRPQGTPIFGAPEVTMEHCVSYIKSVNPNPKLECTLEELVRFYYEEAAIEGIRADLAVAQAIKETGFFNYGGDVVPEQNNYCGLGTTGGGVKGAYFESPRIGVRAQIQHLLGYASDRPPFYPIVDPRYDLLKTFSSKFAQCSTWESLNGNWAVPGVGYGESIVKIVENIKAFESQ